MSLSTHQRIRRQMDEKKKAQKGNPKAPGYKELSETKTAASPENIIKMNLPELRKFAGDNSINITGLRKTDEVRGKILESLFSDLEDGGKPKDDKPKDDKPKGDKPGQEGNGENDADPGGN